MIDSRAAIAPGAKLGANVTVAPFAVIDNDVVIGDNCSIGPHAHITGHTTIGDNTVIHAGANIGDAPQDLSYRGQLSYTEIGKDCIIREYVTVHRGAEEGSKTVIGDHVMLMAFSHVGHDTIIARDVVVANATLLAGHVTVGEHAFISANVMIHQFVRIGRLAMVGGGNAITQDVPPFCLLQWDQIQGPNIVGLRRSGMDETTRNTLRAAIKTYFFDGLARQNAVAKIQENLQVLPEVQEVIDFIMSTQRGIIPGRDTKPHHREN
ncbi:MAG: acyl-ACP--UDP-N-acetylglucosamine O-acyltransferase [Victivallales bacterium]|nr:acyl-ACP--UDP-N-acetylglucosamine O-acyltransferase [Victivallales bacterium]